jgi:hypothetical protein
MTESEKLLDNNDLAKLLNLKSNDLTKYENILIAIDTVLSN